MQKIKEILIKVLLFLQTQAMVKIALFTLAMLIGFLAFDSALCFLSLWFKVLFVIFIFWHLCFALIGIFKDYIKLLQLLSLIFFVQILALLLVIFSLKFLV